MTDEPREDVLDYAPRGEQEQPPSQAEEQRQPGMFRWILETVLMVAIAFALAQGIKTFIVQPFVIPTGSMEPTIMTGDRILAEKISYRFREPDQGEIVVFDDPTGVHPQLIKRVIAVEGQTVDIRDDRVFVNGEPLPEPYIEGAPSLPGDVDLPLTVPENEVFVMGDNRPNSQDSRFIGTQPVSGVKGRAFAIYWPPSRIGGL